MDNRYNLKFNKVFVFEDLIFYEIENSKGNKIYFNHRSDQYITLNPNCTAVKPVTEEAIKKELVRSHNEYIANILSGAGFLYTFIEVNGLMLLLPRKGKDEKLWQWIEA